MSYFSNRVWAPTVETSLYLPLFLLSIICTHLWSAQNTTMLPLFPSGQDESAPGQEAAIAGTCYSDAPFDHKCKPRRGGVFGNSLIEVIELFRPILSIKDLLLQKIFFTKPLFPQSEDLIAAPVVIGWKERRATNIQNEIIISEFPVVSDSSKPETPATSSSPASSYGSGSMGAITGTDQRPKPQKRKLPDEQPPKEDNLHNCHGRTCAACNNAPCHCQNCQGISGYSSQKKIKRNFVGQSLSMSENIVFLLSLKQSTGQDISNQAWAGFSQHRLESMPQGRQNNRDWLYNPVEANVVRILDVDHMDILAVLPDGQLVIKGSSLSLSIISEGSTHFLGTGQIGGRWNTIELSLTNVLDAEVIILDFRQFIVRNNHSYTYFQKHNRTWQGQDLGDISAVRALGNGRLLTIPPWDYQVKKFSGNYQVWSNQDGQLVPTSIIPIGEAPAPVIVLKKTHRIISFHAENLVQIWTESKDGWSSEVLTREISVIDFIELDDGRLVSRNRSGLGVWHLKPEGWFYQELESDDIPTTREFFLLGFNQFFSWQRFSKGSVKIWRERNHRWFPEELAHGGGEFIKGAVPLDKQQLITWSSMSARVWRCHADRCSSTELPGLSNLQELLQLSDGRIVTVSTMARVQIWYEKDNRWSSVYLRLFHGSFISLKELPGGYLATTHNRIIFPFKIDSMTSIWDLFPEVSEPEGFKVEHLERTEHTDSIVEYKSL